MRHRGGLAVSLHSSRLTGPSGGRSLHSDPWREGHRALPRSGPINRSVRPSTPAGQVAGPVIHEPAATLEQVRAGIGRLHPVPDHMRQSRLNHLPGMIRILSRPVSEAGAEAVRHRRDRLPAPPPGSPGRDGRAGPGACVSPSCVGPGCSTHPRRCRFSRHRGLRHGRGAQVEGRLAETELRPRHRVPMSSGSLSGPAIPVSPQAAKPAISEREIGVGGVSGCSGMPESEKVQPARQSSRIQGAGGKLLTVVPKSLSGGVGERK